MGPKTMCLVLGRGAWHHSIMDNLTDDGVSSANSSLAAATASEMRKDDSIERSVIFTFHVVFLKRKDSIKSGSVSLRPKSFLPLFSILITRHEKHNQHYTS